MRLCADDYGLNPAVSNGILNLIQEKKINSVSCLTTTDCWKQKASALNPFLKTISAGLHLSLTEPKPVYFTASSLRGLITKSYFRDLKKQDITQEIRIQLEMFSNGLGVLPNYIDGHEFCHHLPVVREALIDIAREFHFKKKQYLYSCFLSRKTTFIKKQHFLAV